MRHIFRNLVFVFITLAIFQSVPPVCAQPSRESEAHVKITLIPEMTVIEGGASFYVAVHQEMEEGWHTYWRNPGDSGLAPKITWHLPEGFETSALLWPIPETVLIESLTNYGYHGNATLLQEMRAPSSLPQNPLTFSATFDILVCKDICIPERHEASFTLNDGAMEDHAQVITDAFAALPVDVDWAASYAIGQDNMLTLDLKVVLPGLITEGGERMKFDVLPYEWGLVNYGAPTLIKVDERFLRIIFKKEYGGRALADLGETMFLVTFEDLDSGRKGALEVRAKPDPIWLVQEKEKQAQAASSVPAPAPVSGVQGVSPSLQGGLWGAVFFALLGGLILNLMPCVFPILSMKALSLAKMHGKENAEARLGGLSYTAGILASFAMIAGVLIVLHDAGNKIGWGFQLQNPPVVLFLSYLLFFVAMNLSGFFEIGGRFMGAGGALGAKKGMAGAFFTGILTALVATPCTAPFMGVAIGYALLQPAPVALLVFLALGFGLALPYLILSFFPLLRAFLPKPGAWMGTFREFLAFPVYASALWLIWVFGQQVSEAAFLYALCGFAAAGFVVWGFHIRLAHRLLQSLLRGFGLSLLAGLLFLMLSAPPRVMTSESQENAHSRPYSAAAFAEAEAGDAPLFVNMTASWCITCKVNEKIALDAAQTRKLFQTHGVLYFKGDWTNQNPEITAFLEQYGRNGVPLYVYYGARDPQTGKRPAPVILPQLLTSGVIARLVGAAPVP